MCVPRGKNTNRAERNDDLAVRANRASSFRPRQRRDRRNAIAFCEMTTSNCPCISAVGRSTKATSHLFRGLRRPNAWPSQRARRSVRFRRRGSPLPKPALPIAFRVRSRNRRRVCHKRASGTAGTHFAATQAQCPPRSPRGHRGHRRLPPAFSKALQDCLTDRRVPPPGQEDAKPHFSPQEDRHSCLSRIAPGYLDRQKCLSSCHATTK